GAASRHLPDASHRAAGPPDEVRFFSLDLSADRSARVKVYTAHPEATAERIETAISSVRREPGEAARFCRTMGGTNGPYASRPILTCLAFVAGRSTPTATLHFPVRCYAHDDAIVRDRVLGWIHPEGRPIYLRALDAFARRRLDAGVGMQTYVSLRL